MNQIFTSVFILALSIIGLLQTNLVMAADAPVSKCITTATKATHASVTTRMEKDIAPYDQNVLAANAIKTYRDNILTAWAAINEPYCGYGSYGNASAIKSYSKSIDRARAAFLASVKSLQKTSVPSPAPLPVVAQTSSAGSAAIPLPQAPIPTGLRIGMRSSGVMLLQQRLTTYFKIEVASITTGYFGPKTEDFVKKFQLEKKIIATLTSPGAGFVGPKTAAALNVP